MERVITSCVLIFHLGLVASFPFAFPGGYNIAYGEPQSQYQHYQSFAQPQPVDRQQLQPVYGQQPQYNSAVRASAPAYAGNAYNNAYQQLPSAVQTPPFVNGQQRQNYQNVLASTSHSPQQIQEQIAAQIKEQQAKDAVQRLVSQLPSVNGPASQWPHTQATTGVHQKPTEQSPDIVNPYAQFYQHVVQRPQQNYDPQFLQQWKERFQTPETTKKKPYLVIYSDGRTEYVDKIDIVKQNYPNYVLVNAHQIPNKMPPPGSKQQSKSTVPNKQQNPASLPQPPQKPQKSQIKPEPDFQQSQVQSTPDRPTAHQSQTFKLPSNPSPQNPLASLILNSTSAPTEPQPSSVPQQPPKSTAVASADVNPTPTDKKPKNKNQSPEIQKSPLIPTKNKDSVPTSSNVIADTSVTPPETQDRPTDSNKSQPLSKVNNSLEQSGQNKPKDKTQTPKDKTKSPTTKHKPESQNPVLENELQQPSKSNNQTQKKPSDSNKQPQSKPSKPEQQSLPQSTASKNLPQPETSETDDQSKPKTSVLNKEPQPKSPNVENLTKPKSSNPNQKPEPQLSSPKNTKEPQEQAPSPSSVSEPEPDDEDSEEQLKSSDKPDAQPQPQSTKPKENPKKDAHSPNRSDFENKNSQPADKSEPQPQKQPSDDSPSDTAIAAKPNPSQSPGKIIVIDNTGLKSGDLPSIDSEILSNLLGDSPYAVIQFFLVKPQRTIEKEVTRIQFGDDHILEEITQTDKYDDDEPVVTHETHLLKIPQLE